MVMLLVIVMVGPGATASKGIVMVKGSEYIIKLYLDSIKIHSRFSWVVNASRLKIL